jgi:hypothetical protein
MATFGKFKNFTSLALALRAIWMRELLMESAVSGLYNMASSTKAAERTRGLGKLGLVSEFKGTLETVEPEEGELKTFTHKAYADQIPIEMDLIKDEEYNVVNQMLSEHAMSYDRTVVYHMSAPFNNAFASSGLGAGAADGRALCSTGRNGGKAVLNNKGTSALTHDNVTATRELMRQFKNPQGLVLRVLPDTLVVPVGLEAEADEIVNSVNRSDNANNATNTNRNMGYIVDPLLDDQNNWFMVDSRLSKKHLWWFWRERPGFVVHPASEYDLVLRTRGYMRYAFGPDDFTWIYGHEVA